jgi:hypothetical protein
MGRLLRQRTALKFQAPLIGRQYNYDVAGHSSKKNAARPAKSSLATNTAVKTA